jgi:RNA polymerase sigma-70 factor (ECF subfamily)
MELIKENSKSVLEQWVNQFSDELYSWAFFKLPPKKLQRIWYKTLFWLHFIKLIALKVKVSLRPGCFQYSTIK